MEETTETGTINVKALDTFLAPAIHQQTQKDFWFEIQKDSVYNAIPINGSYQIYTNQVITKPLSKESFEEVLPVETWWGLPFFILCILALFGIATVLPEMLKKYQKDNE